MKFILYDQWGEQLRFINDVILPKRKRNVLGKDTLDITVIDKLEKYQRIVFQDHRGIWCEYIVSDVRQVRKNGKPYYIAHCEQSMIELRRKFMVEFHNQDVTALTALEKILEGTKWEPGSISNVPKSSGNFYHIDGYESLLIILNNWGLEAEPVITMSGDKVFSRKINLKQSIGSDTGKRFTNTKDLIGIERQVNSEDVFTRCYAYGKGIAEEDDSGVETGGYSRKIDFKEVNGGKSYIEDNEAKKNWGVLDASGTLIHSEGMLDFPECEDPTELLKLTKEAHKDHLEPRISYVADVLSYAKAGLDVDGSDLGDYVSLIDTDFPVPIRTHGRVVEIEENLLGDSSETVLTIGNFVDYFSQVDANNQKTLNKVNSNSSSWDSAASLKPDYIDDVIDGLNTQMNATGGWTYMEPGEGIIVYDKPVDQNPTKAIQLGGGHFRIANKKKSDGTWEWRTFGTGDGFVADEIVAGVIKGGSNYWNLETGELKFSQGGIFDKPGKNYWNLNTGEFSLSATSTVGGKTVQQIADSSVSSYDATLDQQKVFNKLTNNGRTQGIYLSGGLLYINATYIKTGIITDNAGQNTWNLNTGSLVTKNITATGSFISGTRASHSTELSSGYMYGYMTNTRTFHLNPNITFVSGQKGCRIDGYYYLILSAPMIAVGRSTSDNGTTTSTNSRIDFVHDIKSLGGGSISWSYGVFSTINGMVTSASW